MFVYYECLNTRPWIITGKHIIETVQYGLSYQMFARWHWVQKALRRRYTKLKDFSRRFSNCSSRISHLGNFPLHEIEHENAICMRLKHWYLFQPSFAAGSFMIGYLKKANIFYKSFEYFMCDLQIDGKRVNFCAKSFVMKWFLSLMHAQCCSY